MAKVPNKDGINRLLRIDTEANTTSRLRRLPRDGCLNSLTRLMSEWESEEDAKAFRDL